MLLAVAPVATPSSFVLSAPLIEPAALVVAAVIEMAGVVVPVATWIGAVPVVLVTVPRFAVAPVATPASLVKSAALIEPGVDPVAALIPIAGVPPPVDVIGAVPVTADTPPPPAVALIV